jgi:hypothetical protein
MAINRITVTDPEDLAGRLAWALMREGRFALPHAERKGPVRLTLDHCREVARLMVHELQTRGWIEATFEVQDGRAVNIGRAEAASGIEETKKGGG